MGCGFLLFGIGPLKVDIRSLELIRKKLDKREEAGRSGRSVILGIIYLLLSAWSENTNCIYQAF